ncbi:MAG: SIR2 family protein [Gammaproteobacteria bacterium]|nr:SIR2 family protein [Gammaproteobacteria bacterium]
MDSTKFQKVFIPHLRGHFGKGSVVLFLGAGFSLEAKNTAGKSIPSASKLTKQLWKLCFPNDKFDQTTQLQDIYETALSMRRNQLDELMKQTFTIKADACPDWYGRLLTMPWLRIYTLNIDNLVQQVLSIRQTTRQIRTISAITTIDPDYSESSLSIVHLNGTLDDLPENVTFSRSQYARRTDVDHAYVQLRNDLLFRSVIFIGSSMEEGPLWQHLEMRGPQGHRGQHEIRPRSYLVVPKLNRSKEAILARFNVEWLPMSGGEFCESVVDMMSEERKTGLSALAKLSFSNSKSPEHFSRVGDLSSRDIATEEYLLGAEPTWADITSGKVAIRDCFEEIWNQINYNRNNSARCYLIITGTAGTGKTSALMYTALRLEADGVPVAWMDSTACFSRYSFRNALKSEEALGALFINDADIYENRLPSIVVDALEKHPKLILVCEMRSTKVDRLVHSYELNGIESTEYTVPVLGDNDIDSILDVLDKEHRLGRLKGLARSERRKIFEGQAGRQLLVAMHYATSGKDFGEKAKQELKEMPSEQKYLYGLISVAYSHRFQLGQDDIGIACSDQITSWLQNLDALVRRKLIMSTRTGIFRARHRMIAQFVYESLVEEGRLSQIVSALIRIGATKTTEHSPRDSRHRRMLRAFVNHNFMRHVVGVVQARQIYSDFQDSLAWDYHYWLHRGALELESDNLDVSENFLNQAKSIYDSDVYIDNELAYLSFKKANHRPAHQDSPRLVRDAIESLNDIVRRRPNQINHAYHIMGQQGLIWAKEGISDPDEKQRFLIYLQKKVKQAINISNTDVMRSLEEDVRRAILSLAISEGNIDEDYQTNDDDILPK